MVDNDRLYAAMQTFIEAYERNCVASVRRELPHALRKRRCVSHGQSPSVEISGTNLSTLRYEIRACCPTEQAAAKRESEKLISKLTDRTH